MAATKKRSRKKALAPRTEKSDPAMNAHGTYVLVPRISGVRVNEDTALTLGAVWGCVKVISEDIAGMPWRVMERRNDGGSDPRPEDPMDWLLQTQASPETSAFQFREAIIAHALTWGNGYAEIERDGAGRPVWLWLLTPDRVTPMLGTSGIVYEVSNPVGDPTYLDAEDVFHLRGLGFDGLVGYSVIRFAARSIGIGIALDQSASDLFENDSTPGGLLKHPGRLSDTARDNLRKSWQERHGGRNRRKVGILEEGMSWEQTGLPPEDTKLIEQREFTPADICRWFRVGPHKIADLTRATFSNIEHMGREHVTDTLLPWIRRLETEANIKGFGRTNRGRRFTKINPKSLMRGDTAAQTAHLTAMLERGVYDINEARDYLDLNPIPDGEKRFVQLNMQLLENAGEDPVPAPSATPPQSGDQTQPSDPPAAEEPQKMARLESKSMPLLEQACQRILTRESRIAGKGKPVDEADRRDFAEKQLEPVVQAVAALYGVDSAGLVDKFIGANAAFGDAREMAASLRELIQGRNG